MTYLFDTNICIYIIKNKYKQIAKKMQEVGIEEICISSITVAELEYGIAKSSKKEENRLALLEFLIPFTILDFDQNDATKYGQLRYNLQKAGTPIGNMDLLIASQALARDMTLITNNEKEFSRIQGLKIENWIK